MARRSVQLGSHQLASMGLSSLTEMKSSTATGRAALSTAATLAANSEVDP